MSPNILLRPSPFPNLKIPVINAAKFVLYSKDFIARLSRTAIFDDANEDDLTFQQLRDNSESFAAGLVHKLAFRKGDVLAVYSPNNLHYSTLVFGTLLAGGTVTTINANYTLDELVTQLADSRASVLITHPSNTTTAKTAAEKVGIPLNRVLVIDSDAVDGIEPLFDIFVEDVDADVVLSDREIMDMPAYLTYSSGTTGKSKGVMTTHYNMVSNILQSHYYINIEPVPNDVWLGVLPFSHTYGLNVMLHLAPFTGIPVAIMESFDFIFFLKSIQERRITTLYIVPPVIVALANHPVVDRFDVSSLKRIVSGAAPLSEDVSMRVLKRVGVRVNQGYGLTETSPLLALCPFGTDGHTGSVGVLAPNMDARVVDPVTGTDVGVGESGELWVRGPNVMKGYYRHPEATAEAIDADGFFHTGDIVTISDDHYITIVDRLKEIIKCSGLQVSPAEIEAILTTHSKIADAAVISCPDENLGELPLAYVVLSTGESATADEIQSYVSGKVAPHKQLRGGVFFIDAIPRAVSGKILRRVLRQKYATESNPLSQA